MIVPHLIPEDVSQVHGPGMVYRGAVLLTVAQEDGEGVVTEGRVFCSMELHQQQEKCTD